MRKLLLLLLLPSLVFAQSGEGYVNYKSYKTHYGNGSSSTYNNYTYSGLANSSTELEAMLDTNHPGTTLTHQGEAQVNTSYGFIGGKPPHWYQEYYAVHHWGWFQAGETGTYRFLLQSDDASALWIDEELVLFRPCCGSSYVDVDVVAGQWYRLDTKWQEYTGGDYMRLYYSPPSSTSWFNIGVNDAHMIFTNIEPDTTPTPEVYLDLQFNSQMAPEEFKFRVYYDATTAQDGTEWLNTSTMNSSYYLDDDGTKNITNYLNLVKSADEVYKGHKVGFMNPSSEVDGWIVDEFIDDYITVADVVAAFNELSGGGINGGYKGDLNGVQLQNADVNGDTKFDFQDTQIGLTFLTGGETPFNGTLGEIMRLVPKSEYDGTTTSNWTTQTSYSPSTNILFSLKDTIQTLEYKVSFLGDVNLSHSAPQTPQTTTSARIMSTRYSSTQKDNSLEVNLDVEKTEEHIIITLDLPQNNFNLVGSEFRIGFDNKRVEYDRLETNSTLNNFNVKRDEYIKIGSISTDNSQNLNNGVQYKIYFKPIQTFDSILGLVSIKKSEVVDASAKQIGVIIK